MNGRIPLAELRDPVAGAPVDWLIRRAFVPGEGEKDIAIAGPQIVAVPARPDLIGAARIIEGSARSMGLRVVEN